MIPVRIAPAHPAQFKSNGTELAAYLLGLTLGGLVLQICF